MSDFVLDDALRAARIALDGLSLRQELIGNNVANIDTPGYKAQEVEFETALQQAIGSSKRLQMKATSGSHLASRSRGVHFRVNPRAGVSSRADGNTVNIDSELSQMAETGIRYQALTRLVNRKLDLLKEIARR